MISDGDTVARYNETFKIASSLIVEGMQLEGPDPIHVSRGYCSQKTPQGHSGGGGLD